MGNCHQSQREPQTIESFPVVYIGSVHLPPTAYVGVDICYHAVMMLNQERKGEESKSFSENRPSPQPVEENQQRVDLKDMKATLTVSIYGVKVLVSPFTLS